jgi:hypothetical protein
MCDLVVLVHTATPLSWVPRVEMSVEVYHCHLSPYRVQCPQRRQSWRSG